MALRTYLGSFLHAALGMLLGAATVFSHAHLMPAQQGSVNVVADAAFVVLAVPTSAMTGVDDNRDGRLSEAELMRHRDTLAAQVSDRFAVHDAGVRTPVQVLQVIAEPDERASLSGAAVATQLNGGARHFLVLMRHKLGAQGEAVAIHTDLFGSFADEKQLTLKLSRGADMEAAVLTPLQPSHRFFQSPFEVLVHYGALGIEHILLGWDHLLFLLTLMVGVRAFRDWFALLTSFTVAHSITLFASLLGWLKASPAWVEPGIAASIVILAALNLLRTDMPLRWRTTLVWACGLLHGLGFAGAMAQMGLHGVYQVTSLLGFNLGIEIGQGLFIAMAWGGARMMGQMLYKLPLSPPLTLQLVRSGGVAASWGAIGLGSFWLLARLGGTPVVI